MDEFVTKILQLAQNATGMQLAWVSRLTDDRQIFDHVEGDIPRFGITPGDSGALCDSYCVRVNRGELPRSIPDTADNAITAALAVTHELNIGSYVGTPIHDDEGSVVGMLCAISDHPRAELPDDVLRQLEMLAGIVSLEIRRSAVDVAARDELTERVGRWIRGEGFYVHHQPIVDLQGSGRPVGFEALSRFGLDPENPAGCFGQAWSAGLGPDLEIAAIAAAVTTVDRIPEECYLSVNASPDPEVLRRIAGAVPGHAIERLVIEVTEHTEIRDYDEVGAALHEVRAAGARLAVDDAGAGYASFRHVLQLRPDYIKLDISLTRGIHDDVVKQALVSSWVGLATSLGASLVSEGIEAVEEQRTLTRLGVDAGQGFLFARPALLDTWCVDRRLVPGWKIPSLTEH